MKQFKLFLASALAIISPSLLMAQSCPGTGLGLLMENTVYQDSPNLDPRGAASNDSVWYNFSVPAVGYLTVSSCDAVNNFDTRLFLYDGVACNNLSLVATSDNDCGFSALLNDRKVVPGKTYYILWDNKSTVDPLAFDFTVEYVSEATYQLGVPANDDICNASAIAVDDTLTNQSNEYASVQGVAEFNLGNDPGIQNVWMPDFNVHNTVWFSFVAPASGAAGIELINTAGNWDAQMAVFSGNCNDFSSLDFVAASEAGTNMDPMVNMFSLVAGETYWVLVDGFGTESGDFDIAVRSIDLRGPYTILFDPDTNAFPVFACPNGTELMLTANLVVAADSSDIVITSSGSAYDNWYENALNEYVATIEWSLNDATGMGVNAWDDELGAGTYTATFDDNFRPAWSADFTFTEETRDPLAVAITSIDQPACVGSSGEIEFEVTGGYKFQSVATYSDDSVYVWYKRVSIAAGTAALDAAPLQGPIIGASNFFSTQLTEAHYRLIVEDGCENFDSTDFTMNDPVVTPMVAQVDLTINPYCDGSATGEIEVSATGGQNAPYTYVYRRADTLTTNEPDTLVYTTVAGPNTDAYRMAVQGWYQIIVGDGCGSDADTVYTQVVDPGLDQLMVDATVTDPTTFGAQDGSVNLNVSGGSGDYRITWFVNDEEATDLENVTNTSNLAQALYEIYVEDSCGNVGSWDTTFIMLAPLANDEPCDAISIAEGDSLTLFSNEGATVNGAENLSIPTDADEGYNGWEENDIQSSVWFSFEAPASGAVSIEVEGLAVLGNLSFDPQVAVFAATDCADFGTFTYLSANDDQNVTPVNNSYLETYCLTPGVTYYILVDGYAGIGQEGLFNIYIEELDVEPLTVLWSKTNETCVDPGTISIDSIGGGVFMTSPEDFSLTVNFNNGDSIITNLSPGLQNIEFTDLAAGTYNVQVSDTCGVGFDIDITIDPYDAGALVITPSVTNPTCPGGNDGVIQVIYTNGVGGYNTTFTQLTGGAENGGPLAGDTIEFSLAETGDAITAGSYFFTVTDDCGNFKQYEVEVEDPVYAAFDHEVSSIDPTCTGGDDAEFTIDITGGSGHFYITVFETGGAEPIVQGIDDSLIMGQSFNVADLMAKDYYYVVRDFCTPGDTAAQDTVKIVDPVFDAFTLDVETMNPSDSGAADGWFAITVEGGATPYTIYAMSLDNGFNIVDTLTIENDTVFNVKAGLYQVEAADICGGLNVEIFEINNPPTNDDACDADPIAAGQSITASNIAATVETGEISGLAIPANENCTDLTGWCLGDNIDGSVWYVTTVPASGALQVDVTSNDFDVQLAIFGDACTDFNTTLYAANDDISGVDFNSSISLGCLTPGEELYILIDANVTANPTAGGDYTITVTEITTGDIDLTASVIDPTTEISTDGFIDLTISGGFAPYTITWTDNGVVSGVTTQDRNNITAGTYAVSIVDACGATADTSFTLVNSLVSNDDVCGAILLPVDGENRIFENKGATVEPGEANIAPDTDGNCFSNTESKWCSGDGLDASIWFKFYAPASGKVTVDLCNGGNNTFDTQVAAYRSNTCTNFAAFNLVGANDDWQSCALGSRLDLEGLEPCGLYYVLVDTDDDYPAGEMGIRLSDPAKTINAGKDVNTTVCQEDGDVDLALFLDPAADAGGTFVDVDNTGELVGSIFSADNVAPGTYKFEYQLFSTCDNQTSAADVAVITVRVEDCVGITENAELQLSVYPNPTSGIVNLKANRTMNNVDVIVVDIAGKQVASFKDAFSSANQMNFSMEGLAKGIYTVKLTGAQNASYKVVLK